MTAVRFSDPFVELERKRNHLGISITLTIHCNAPGIPNQHGIYTKALDFALQSAGPT
jgi:hypothetical protein